MPHINLSVICIARIKLHDLDDLTTATMAEKSIGFVGLGKMGKWMAINLVKGGRKVTVCDINDNAANELLAMGAR